MIELPGCRLGSVISPRPARGPEASQRRSFAIFVSETAIVLSAPETSTAASRAASASKRLGARTKGWPVAFASRSITRVGELGRRVEAGADGGAAERELGEARLDARRGARSAFSTCRA